MSRSVTRVVTGAIALLCSLGVARPALADVGVSVNGEAVDFSPPPIVQAGRVFVPLRGVFERLGATVVYADGEIDATGSGRDVSLHIGSTQGTIDGQTEILDVAPFIVGASTFVPLRFVSEALGASVNYDASDDQIAITTAGNVPSYAAPEPQSDGNDGTYASYAPPPLPSYAQPYVPEANDIWQPGYWAWGPYGYFWVPGTWVAPPQPGYLWTPGYWSAGPATYAWHPGFWAVAVGFYGGVNYGFGYFGNGYNGGRWHGNTFSYNTYVTHVNATIVRNTYVDRTVVVDRNVTRISYNGGANGLRVRPTARQQTLAHGPHLGVTPAQQQHVRVAEQDRRLLATVNHAKPPVAAVARPLDPANRPVGFEAVKRIPQPMSHEAAARMEPVAAPRAVEPATRRTLPQTRVAPQARVAPERFAPTYVAPHPAAAAVRPRAIVQPARVIPPPPHANAYRPAMRAPQPEQPARHGDDRR